MEILRKEQEDIFSQASTTFFAATRLFPKEIRDDITTVYAFIKSVENFAHDKKNRPKFFEWNDAWQEGWNGETTNIDIVDAFLDVSYRFQFQRKWIEAFFASMKFDMQKKKCTTLADCIWYMYGSAEVLGVMIAKIMNTTHEAEKAAALLGRSFQYVGFMRDFARDSKQGKQYLPPDETITFKKPETDEEKEAFSTYIKKQLAVYYSWQHEAEKGFKYIPYKSRVAVMTMSDMILWTANTIAKNPLIIFEKRVTPSKQQFLLTTIKNRVKAVTLGKVPERTYAEKIYENKAEEEFENE